MKVHRATEALIKQKLVKKYRDAWKLTTAGETEFKRLKEETGKSSTVGLEVETTDEVFDE